MPHDVPAARPCNDTLRGTLRGTLSGSKERLRLWPSAGPRKLWGEQIDVRAGTAPQVWSTKLYAKKMAVLVCGSTASQGQAASSEFHASEFQDVHAFGPERSGKVPEATVSDHSNIMHYIIIIMLSRAMHLPKALDSNEHCFPGWFLSAQGVQTDPAQRHEAESPP